MTNKQADKVQSEVSGECWGDRGEGNEVAVDRYMILERESGKVR